MERSRDSSVACQAYLLARTVQKTARNRSRSLTVIVAEHSSEPHGAFDSGTTLVLEVDRLRDAVSATIWQPNQLNPLSGDWQSALRMYPCTSGGVDPRGATPESVSYDTDEGLGWVVG